MSGQSSLARRRTEADDASAPISAFESETQGVIGVAAPRSERTIIHAVGFLFAFVILLMCVISLDRVVAGTGFIVPTEGSLYLQPMDRVIVRKVNVSVGQIVKKGQVLATTDPVFTSAAEAQLVHQATIDGALLARLEAEEAGVPYQPKGSDSDELMQLATYVQVEREYNQSVANFDAQIRSTTQKIAGAKEDARKYAAELAVNTKILNSWKELDHRGFGSALQQETAETTMLESARNLADAESLAAQSGHDLEALQAQKQAYIGTFHDQLGTALVTARTNYNADVQGLIKARESRTVDEQVIAPMDAIVLNVANASVGTVVDPSTSGSQPLFTLTPVGGPLEVEIDVDTKDQGFVRPGDKVRLKFDAYKFVLYGTGEGVVKNVSSSSFTVDQNGQPTAPYFKVRVGVTKLHLHGVPKDFRLRPGMTLAGDIIVGRRTIMTYIVEGALRTGREAMREP